MECHTQIDVVLMHLSFRQRRLRVFIVGVDLRRRGHGSHDATTFDEVADGDGTSDLQSILDEHWHDL